MTTSCGYKGEDHLRQTQNENHICRIQVMYHFIWLQSEDQLRKIREGREHFRKIQRYDQFRIIERNHQPSISAKGGLFFSCGRRREHQLNVQMEYYTRRKQKYTVILKGHVREEEKYVSLSRGPEIAMSGHTNSGPRLNNSYLETPTYYLEAQT